ncbi:hypothetical protein UPYG_G00073040 [Umbra pygmaea]|uniref:Uncharacterized protein n=1 Tax=Umbra pygmaea TaxID=75934 RepID=A0ABD0XWR6_UMBPY
MIHARKVITGYDVDRYRANPIVVEYPFCGGPRSPRTTAQIRIGDRPGRVANSKFCFKNIVCHYPITIDMTLFVMLQLDKSEKGVLCSLQQLNFWQVVRCVR